MGESLTCGRASRRQAVHTAFARPPRHGIDAQSQQKQRIFKMMALI